MDIIQQKIKSYIISAVLCTLLLLVIGCLLLFFPEFSLDVIRWSLSIGLLSIGLYKIIADSTLLRGFFTGSIGGVILAVMGLVIALYPDVLNIVPILLGIWMIASSIASLRFSVALRGASFVLSRLVSIATIVVGVILIANPMSSIALTAFIGLMLMIYSTASLIEIIIFSVHLKEIATYFKKNVKSISVKSKVKK